MASSFSPSRSGSQSPRSPRAVLVAIPAEPRAAARRSAPPSPSASARRAAAPASDQPPTRRVLVVDDDPSLRLLLRTTLALDELEVEEASGAVEAEALARFRRPAAAIVDVGLADGDGLALCRELKRMGRDDPPTVILLTGAETSEEEAAAAGADGLLRKPFSPLELLGLLDRLSSRARRRPARAGPQRRGPAPALRARPQPAARHRAAAAPPAAAGLQADDRRARRRARGEGQPHRHARDPGAAVRARDHARGRPRACSTTRASSTGSCSTTSARSPSPTRS